MRDGVAETVAEAMAQEITFPLGIGWTQFAHWVDGYTIAQELGFDLHEWGIRVVAQHKIGEPYGLDALHLRLALFYLSRWDRHSNQGDNPEFDRRADELLRELAAALNQPYEEEGE